MYVKTNHPKFKTMRAAHAYIFECLLFDVDVEENEDGLYEIVDFVRDL